LCKLFGEGKQEGLVAFEICSAIGISLRTIQRWRRFPEKNDQRKGPTKSHRKFSEIEENRIFETVNSKEFFDLPVSQIVPRLADRGIYIGSEATIYRLLKKSNMLTHRSRATKPKRKAELKYIATKPNEIWSWDITFMNSPVRGQHFKLYMFEDIFSRKIVGTAVHESETDLLAAELVQDCFKSEGITGENLRIHSDNGRPMRGSIMLYTLQRLGAIPSFSRPSVSNDNAFSEALFKTMKYCPKYPYRPFRDIEACRAWVESFVDWYNNVHLHSGIGYVTPNQRHLGQDQKILNQRREVYDLAKTENPHRWSKKIRLWKDGGQTMLNPYGLRTA